MGVWYIGVVICFNSVLIVRWEPVRLNLRNRAACLIKYSTPDAWWLSFPRWNLHHLNLLWLLKSHWARMYFQLLIFVIIWILWDIFHHIKVHFIVIISWSGANPVCIKEVVFLIWAETQTSARFVVIPNVTEVILVVARLISRQWESLTIIKVVYISTPRGR